VHKPANCFYLSCCLHGDLHLRHRHWAVRCTPW